MRPTVAATTARYLILSAMAAAVLLPFISIVLAAFQPSGAQIAGLEWPSAWSWSNFAAAWNQAHFNTLVVSSLIIAVGVVPLALVLSTLAGYALAVLKPFGGRAISTAFVLGLTLPVELVVVALYFDLQAVGLTNSYLGIILAEAALFLPFGVYWMQNHFASIPLELIEAARVDGANVWQRFVNVTLPCLRPTMFFVTVMLTINSFKIFDLILVMTDGGPGQSTLVMSQFIYRKGFEESQFGYASAAAVVLFFMCIIVTILQFLWNRKRSI